MKWRLINLNVAGWMGGSEGGKGGGVGGDVHFLAAVRGLLLYFPLLNIYNFHFNCPPPSPFLPLPPSLPPLSPASLLTHELIK